MLSPHCAKNMFTCLSFIVKVNTYDMYEVVVDKLCIIFSYIYVVFKILYDTGILHSLKVLFLTFLKSSN